MSIIAAMKRASRVLVVLWMTCLYAAAAQTTATSEPPVVKSGETPLYPQLARDARLQGTVRLEVTTNGMNVTKVAATGAPKMLLEAAEQNIRTWKFYRHTPQTFTVTFVYMLEEPEVYPFANSRVLLEFPNRVEIRTNMPKTMP